MPPGGWSSGTPCSIKRLPHPDPVQVAGRDALLGAHRRRGAGGLAHDHGAGDDADGAQRVELRGDVAAGGQEVAHLGGHQAAVGDLRPVARVGAGLVAARGDERVHAEVAVVLRTDG